MKNVKFKVLEESLKNQKYYALIKISVGVRAGYCVAVEDDELSLQGIGSNEARAKEIYDLFLDQEVSAIHVDEIVRDLQNAIFY